MYKMMPSLISGNVIEVLETTRAKTRKGQLRSLGVHVVERKADQGYVSLDYPKRAMPDLLALETTAMTRRVQANHRWILAV